MSGIHVAMSCLLFVCCIFLIFHLYSMFFFCHFYSMFFYSMFYDTKRAHQDLKTRALQTRRVLIASFASTLLFTCTNHLTALRCAQICDDITGQPLATVTATSTRLPQLLLTCN